jgi:hypothetical protein
MIEDKLYDEFIISIIAAEKGDKTFTFTYKKKCYRKTHSRKIDI